MMFTSTYNYNVYYDNDFQNHQHWLRMCMYVYVYDVIGVC